MFVQPRDGALPACSFSGNSDVYGLGIRVGIYLQWVSSLLSKTFLDEEALRDVLNENAIFLLAIFLATILLVTDTISGVHSLDVLIMLHIFFGSVFTVFLSADIGERIEYYSSLVGIIFKSGMVTGMAAVGAWFWFYDIQPPEDPTCSSFAFLFGRVGLYGNHTIMAFKAFSTINLIYCSSFLLGMISVRMTAFINTLAGRNSKLKAMYPGISAEIMLILVRKSIADRKKLMNDIRVLGTELIIQSTVPLEETQISKVGKLFREDEQQESLGLSDWRLLKQALLENKKVADLKIVQVFLKLGDLIDGSVSSTTRRSPVVSQHLSALNYFEPPSTGRRSLRPDPDQNQTFSESFLDRYYRRITSIPLNTCIFIYSIISIELLIKYNSITDVYGILSTGQIIPFIIGVASLWRTIWKIIVRAIQTQLIAKRKKHEAASEGEGAPSGGGAGSRASAVVYAPSATQTTTRWEFGQNGEDKRTIPYCVGHNGGFP